ncbi:alpha-N-acetylgalactosaminide alpha-2,6-sialyltransferase 2-like [Spea bombifrons]|uniref:alpha-N-acetylgalactosaminide alpha-2,6-sialyltransferase 2-like n=1 Tax=Spea bombifrons TaxID=233779 RepID=UPI00234A2BD4|nr:alpha-N-acetylgalactosaminide alpha-2,6-sialyltransferase 2-like [Spea bombifrons]
MQQTAKFIFCLLLRSKTLKRFLLFLSMVTFLGILVAYKDTITSGVPAYAESADYSSSENESPEDYDISEITDIGNAEVTAKSLTTKPFEVNRRPSNFKIGPLNLTKRSTAMTSKPHKVSTKPPVVTTKPLKATKKLVTTRPHLVTTKPSPVKAFKEASRFSNATAKPFNMTAKPLTRLNSLSTSMPYMGDVYATDYTYLNSTCPNRTRDKLKNSDFKDIYMDTIPVLQWKKHATESEYRRLQRYNGAFGWMGVTWHIVNQTLNLLNASNSGYLFNEKKKDGTCVRCAVVGNGGILNGSGMGEEIDAHDYVFRVNGAITKGFEKDVGNRTSFFFFSTNTMMNSLNSYGGHGFKKAPRSEETRYLLLPDHDRDYLLVWAALTNSVIDRGRDKSKNPRNYFGENLTMEHFNILHPDFMRYLRNRFLWAPILNTKSRDIYRPSTGAAMLLAAVHTCDQVNAYGFMTPNYGNFSDHYFDTKHKKVVFYSNHSFRKEMELWQKLHKAGVIKLYMRD